MIKNKRIRDDKQVGETPLQGFKMVLSRWHGLQKISAGFPGTNGRVVGHDNLKIH